MASLEWVYGLVGEEENALEVSDLTWRGRSGRILWKVSLLLLQKNPAFAQDLKFQGTFCV